MARDGLSEVVSGGYEPRQLRRELHGAKSAAMRRRRAIVGFSLLGGAAMGVVSLLQTGAVEHLPDPPGPWNSDAANLSEAAYQFGIPDGPLAVASMAANLPLAAWGGEDRVASRPAAPVLSMVKAAVDAAGAAGYLKKMITGEEAWCPYCVTGAVSNFAIFALALPEAIQGLRQMLRG